MSKFCKKCNKLLELIHFYKTKNIRTYLDGHIDWCKECLKVYRKNKKVEIVNKEQVSFFHIEQKEIIISFD